MRNCGWAVWSSALGGAIATAALVLCGSGCVATTAPPLRAIVVTGPPPAPLVEERPPRTHPRSVWITGYWHWTGIQYAWIPGHWEMAPATGGTWHEPRYTKSEGAYFYEPGTWGATGVDADPNAPAPRANAFH